jgi:hypothetical protein
MKKAAEAHRTPEMKPKWVADRDWRGDMVAEYFLALRGKSLGLVFLTKVL